MPNPVATFMTTLGSFKVELFADKSPVTVSNFVEYAKAGLPMLPVTHGEAYTRLHLLLYTLLLFAVTMLPVGTGMGGWIYLLGAVGLGGRFIQYGWRLYRRYSDALAKETFRFSIWYLSLLFGVMLVDHYFKIPI